MIPFEVSTTGGLLGALVIALVLAGLHLAAPRIRALPGVPERATAVGQTRPEPLRRWLGVVVAYPRFHPLLNGAVATSRRGPA